MDWANERWVKVYVRDTVTMKLMTWQARCLFWELLRKVDMRGWLELDGHGTAGLAVALGCDTDDAERALAEWIKAGWVDASSPDGILIPTHQEAQSTPQSNALRQRTKRKRHAATRGDTSRHAAARRDTEGVAPDTKRVACDTKRVAPDTSRHAATRRDTYREKREREEIDGDGRARDDGTTDERELAIRTELQRHRHLRRHNPESMAQAAMAVVQIHQTPEWLSAATRRAAAEIRADTPPARAQRILSRFLQRAGPSDLEVPGGPAGAEPSVRPIEIPPEQLAAMRERMREAGHG